jgi:hypothetical protein
LGAGSSDEIRYMLIGPIFEEAEKVKISAVDKE